MPSDLVYGGTNTAMNQKGYTSDSGWGSFLGTSIRSMPGGELHYFDPLGMPESGGQAARSGIMNAWNGSAPAIWGAAKAAGDSAWSAARNPGWADAASLANKV